MENSIEELLKEESLLPLFPSDDFSKRLFIERELKELKKENKNLFDENLKLIDEINDLKNSNAVIRKYSNLKKEVVMLRRKLSKSKKDFSDLIYKFNQKPVKLDTMENSPYDLNKLKNK